jgi:preprotein translocase subunit SecA
MSARDVAETVTDMRAETIEEIVASAIPENSLAEQWDIPGLHAEGLRLLALDLPLADWAKEEGIGGDEIRERVSAAADRKMAEKSANYGPDLMRMAEKSLLLQLLDQTWKDHLLTLDHLRQGINLRAYAQRDPLNEYKREAFELFETMLANLRRNVTSVLSHVELRVEPQPVFAPAAAEPEMAMAEEARATGTTGRPFGPPPRAARRPPQGNGADRPGPRLAAPRSPWAGTPRNAPCPCGSGKKFKHCHGKV